MHIQIPESEHHGPDLQAETIRTLNDLRERMATQEERTKNYTEANPLAQSALEVATEARNLAQQALERAESTAQAAAQQAEETADKLTSLKPDPPHQEAPPQGNAEAHAPGLDANQNQEADKPSFWQRMW